MESTEALLTAYEAQARAAPPDPPAGVWNETDGPLVRVVGEERGFISAPRDTGVRGADLDRLIARQRDYFAARGEPGRISSQPAPTTRPAAAAVSTM